MIPISLEDLLKSYERTLPPSTEIILSKDNYPEIKWSVPTKPKPIKSYFEQESIPDTTVGDYISGLVDAWTALGKIFYDSNGELGVGTLKINNYEYNKPVTKIDWSDGTTTKVSCNPDDADQFSGFLACICKKVFPDYLKEYEKYTEIIPKQKAEEEAKKAEEERIAAKRKAKRDAYKEKRRKIKAAKALAEQYQRKTEEDEIKKIAQEKFGVPKSYFD